MNAPNRESVKILWSSRAGGKRYMYTFHRTVLVDERYCVPAYSEEEARALLEADSWRYGEVAETPLNPISLCEYLDMGFPKTGTEEFELDEDATEEIDDDET